MRTGDEAINQSVSTRGMRSWWWGLYSWLLLALLPASWH
jgi:hypothetical protein